MKNKFLPYIIAAITSLCGICAIGVLAVIVNGNILTTPSPAALLPQPNFSTIIVQTAAAAQTQTMLAMPPSPLSTATLAPLLEIPPTATIFIFSLQTDVAQPTEIIFSTDTPFVLATQTLQPIGGDVGSCSGNTLNCADFGTHASAQACFNYCISQGTGDIHRLDSDNNNIACESLP